MLNAWERSQLVFVGIGVLHVKNIADRRVVPPADLNNSDESRPIKLAIIKGLYYTSLNLPQFPQ